MKEGTEKQIKGITERTNIKNRHRQATSPTSIFQAANLYPN